MTRVTHFGCSVCPNAIPRGTSGWQEWACPDHPAALVVSFITASRRGRRRNRAVDTAVHLRMWWQRGGTWVWSYGASKLTSGVCEANGVPHARSVMKPGRVAITCPSCAVFADAWLEAGMTGRLSARRVRAFRKTLEVRA